MTAAQCEPPKAPISAVNRCRNCGAALTGRYCVNCGQGADVHVPSTTELIHEALEGITHSDSRLWRTLRLLWFKPGELTQEFVAGRRAAYLPPFRLYLVVSVIFFLIASVTPLPGDFVNFDAAANHGRTRAAECGEWNPTLFGREWGPRLQHICDEVAHDNGASLWHVAITTMPKAMFIFLPLVAFLHMLLYWRPRHRYAEHLLFFLHLHAFFFSVMTVRLLAADAATAWPSRAALLGYAPLLFWTLPLYTVIAMRRVFGRSWTGTLFKGFALFVVYMALFAVTVGGVFVYAALQM